MTTLREPGSLVTTTETAVPCTRANVVVCARPGCGEPRPINAKPGRFCSHICRREDSRRRERESYLAPRPLPQEPEARRDELKAVAASNNRHQRAIARWAALMCFGQVDDPNSWLGKHEARVSIASDVRSWCQWVGIELEWTKPWTGSLFHPCEWFEHTGSWRNARHAGSNARPVREWRLTEEGRAAYRMAKGLMR